MFLFSQSDEGLAVRYFILASSVAPGPPQSAHSSTALPLSVRFIVDPKLPATIDRLTLGYAMYDAPDQKQIVSSTGT